MFKVIILVMVIAAVAYGGLCIYSNCAGPATGQPDMPCKEDASHSFYIENTGGLILASEFEQHGREIGNRIFILHGFWEMRGNKFKFVEGEVILDEAIFGEITVKKRTKD